ncbi:hypothetical protein D9M69_698320 [compost metagenome]
MRANGRYYFIANLGDEMLNTREPNPWLPGKSVQSNWHPGKHTRHATQQTSFGGSRVNNLKPLSFKNPPQIE